MRLILFTAHYPFGKGEPFLEDELRMAERAFERITIVTYAKASEQMTRYVPANAEIISLRRDSRGRRQSPALAAAVFRPRVWRAILSGAEERGVHSAWTILKKALLSERHVHCLEKTLANRPELRERETVWYSYWLNASAHYLAMHHGELPGVCIARAHGGDCFYNRGYVPGRTEMLKRLDAVFTISESGRKDLLAHYGAAVPGLADKIRTMPLGVPLPEPGPIPDGAEGEITLVTCSNLVQLKRIDLLIDALAQISDVRIRWVHFGDGPLEDTLRAQAVRQLDGRPNIRCSWMGRTPKNEIMAYYASRPVDLFVNCSDVEGIPVSAMEAMSYGIPVVARNVGGLSELVDDGCGKLLPEIITAEELAEAILCVLRGADGTAVSARREAARRRISERYCSQNNYSVFLEEIKRMCSEAWASKA